MTHGYIDTAVDTLTTEMDRQFKKVRGDIETRTRTRTRVPAPGGGSS